MCSARTIRRRDLAVATWLVLGVVLLGSRALAADEFEDRVAPIFIRHCLECHNDKEAAGKLRLTSHVGLQAGGESGPSIVSGKPDTSHLLERIVASEMPPPKQGKPRRLSDVEITSLREWIAAGAKWPDGRKLDQYERTTDVRGGRDWWSLQPVRRPPIPTPPERWSGRIANPVDSFVLAKLEAANLEPAPIAEPRVLIRRLYYDLTGLPPTFEQVEAFVADHSTAAYERLVDQLLNSPRFGERWGRYWLDLVRYADTCGYERDQEKPNSWKYRDWVLRAFNQDMPYDRFVKAQLAGDEFPDRTEDDVIATGFLMLGTWNDEPNDANEYKYERLEDMIHVSGTAFLGLTVKCARCHDHKFDPIPQLDYYRMAAAFWAGPIEPRGRELLGGPTRDELGFDVLGWTDLTAKPAALRWLRKGDPRHPQDEVGPGYLSAVPALARTVEPPPAGAKTSQRRLQLANWIVDPKNPLTPRVIVNRLWLHHFGRALVRSPDNFGFTGERPTHPELLDWLASELIDGGWRLKRIHKLLVMSATYRQASLHPRAADFTQQDSGNRWWWRAERRRLDAESLRDSFLVSAAALDLRQGGPGFKPTISSEALEGLSRKSGAWSPSPVSEQRRRSVYMYSQRSLLPPLMTSFDFCDTTQPCGQRDVSIVAPQALALLNNPFLHDQSSLVATRIVTIAGEDHGRQVDVAWKLVLGRLPSERERQSAIAHLATQTLNFSRRGGEAADADLESARSVSPAGAAKDGRDDASPAFAELVLHLAADRNAVIDAQGRLESWQDLSGEKHHATQSNPARRPLLVKDLLGGRPVVRFDGEPRDLLLAGQVLKSQQFTIVAVASDRGSGAHRDLFSNWNGAAGNSVTSVFLGTTGDATVRLSDDFAPAGSLLDKKQPFVWTAMSETSDAVVWQNRAELARRGRALSPRSLTTPYVIGQQGNIQGEYWNGDLAELLVFDRALDRQELQRVWRRLERKYGLSAQPVPVVTAAQRALESLCLVLLNSNEFIYID